MSDTQILANKCDGTLLIIHSRVAEKEDVSKAQALLTSSHANILGVILNKYKITKRDKGYKLYGKDEN